MIDFPCCKLEIFIPETHLELLRKALLAASGGDEPLYRQRGGVLF